MQRTPRGDVRRNRDLAKLVQGFKCCPLTVGGPTTMTAEGFAAACERAREQNRGGFKSLRAYKFTWCDTCQGKRYPKGLKIESLQKMLAKRQEKLRKKRPMNVGAFIGHSNKTQPSDRQV